MEGKFPREQPKMDLSMPFAPIYFRDDLSLNYSIYSESKIENCLLFFNPFSQTCSFPWYVFFFHILFTDGKKEKCKKLSWKICTFFQQLFSESFSAIWQTFCGFAKLWKIVDWQKRKEANIFNYGNSIRKVESEKQFDKSPNSFELSRYFMM